MSLTLGTGPLATRPGGAFNFDWDGAPAHRLFFEPYPRRLRALVGDPSALHDIAARLDPRTSFRRLAQALAGDDPAATTAVRCALGAVRSGVIATLLDRPPGEPRGLAPVEADLIVEAGLRAWSVVEG